MPPRVLVSYDGTAGDRDALELGRVFHELGSPLTIAYVRHAFQADPDRERSAVAEAEAVLTRGATLLDDPHVERRVVVNPSTAEGLGRLAGDIGAEMIVFGSEYRTPAGHVAVGRSAQMLLDNGPAAIALAPAGYRAGDIASIGVLPGTADEAAIETAHALADRHEARVLSAGHHVDLLLVGSREQAPEGHVMVSSSAAHAIDQARSPVLVLARGAALSFTTLVTA